MSHTVSYFYGLLAALTGRGDMPEGHIEETLERPFLGNTATQLKVINTVKNAVVTYRNAVVQLANTPNIDFDACLDVANLSHSMTWLNELLNLIDYRYYGCDDLLNHPNVTTTYLEDDLTMPCLGLTYGYDDLPSSECLGDIVDLIVAVLFPQWLDIYLDDGSLTDTLNHLLY